MDELYDEIVAHVRSRDALFNKIVTYEYNRVTRTVDVYWVDRKGMPRDTSFVKQREKDNGKR